MIYLNVQKFEKNICFLKFQQNHRTILSEFLVFYMKAKFEKSQFGNQKGTGVQHYLMKMIHTILCKLDNNSRGDILAVIANLYDWSQAFDLQCYFLNLAWTPSSEMV